METSTIKCVTCGEDFTPYRKSQVACSRPCRDKQPHLKETRAQYLSRPEIQQRKREQKRTRYAADPAQRIRNIDYSLRRNYGINYGDYSRMLGEQNGLCAICGKPASGGIKSAARLHVDHDHATGAVRGLLCSRCNQGIGYFSDNPELLAAAIAYLNARKETT